MNIIWTDEAKACLREIILYGVDNWGLKVAGQFHENIVKTERRLVANPQMGHPEPLLAHRPLSYRSLLLQKNFKLIYRIIPEDNVLLMVDIWDTRREPKKLTRRIK